MHFIADSVLLFGFMPKMKEGIYELEVTKYIIGAVAHRLWKENILKKSGYIAVPLDVGTF